VVVVGLGTSGLSAALFCRQLGARVTVSERRRLAELDPADLDTLKKAGIALEDGGHTLELFLASDLILVSPGVPLDLPILQEARSNGVLVAGEMSLASVYLRTPMLAVTGTNGKTTVTSLLGEIFQASGRKVFVGGNIGTPLTDYLVGPQDADLVILEISSFQLDTALGFRPQVAILLNITADHLDRYDSFTAYGLSKFSIFQHQQQKDVAIVNIDDPVISQFLDNKTSLRHGWVERSSFFFSKRQLEKNGAVLDAQKVKLVKDGREFEAYDLEATALGVSPNLENGMAAILGARAMGCSPEHIRRALAGFKTPAHRLAAVAEISGVRYFDDSKATNVGAVAAALAAMDAEIILIAGGRGKGGDYEPLKKLVRQKVKRLLLIGEAKDEMAEVFGDDTVVEGLDSLAEAVRRASDLAVSGDVVLLSPACASFDMFKSYGERGDLFCRYVGELKEEVRP